MLARHAPRRRIPAARAFCFAATSAYMLAVAASVAIAAPAASVMDAPAEVRIAWVTQAVELPPGLSMLQSPIGNEGLAGARLAIEDNAATGRFTGQRFVLDEHVLAVGDDVGAVVRAIAAAGERIVVADLPAAGLDRLLAEPVAADMLVFNAGAPDDRFRNAECRPFLLHTLPSRAMLADALAQYLVKRSWTRWFLVVGSQPEDALYAAAIRRAAERFGATIAVEKAWASTFDARRTAQEEVPLFTQVSRYDVLVVADEAGLFGDDFLYRTWDPRLVAGTQGLFAAAWLPTQEQWGALQLQTRFLKVAGRRMVARDWAAWVAVRAVGEAAVRTRSTSFEAIDRYVRDPAFELAAFKGRKVSFRPWDGQLRQPIPVGWARALVTMSPQDGFLHPVTELDTLGTDAPETGCKRTAAPTKPGQGDKP